MSEIFLRGNAVDIIEKYRPESFFIGRSPTTDAIRDMRLAFRLSQAEAAKQIRMTPQNWGQCERGALRPNGDQYKMSPNAWELFILKNWAFLNMDIKEIVNISCLTE